MAQVLLHLSQVPRSLEPTQPHTLEVIGLVKAQPDLVPEAQAALTYVGHTEAEAGQTGGTVLQVEVPIGAGPCLEGWEGCGWLPTGGPEELVTVTHPSPPARL